MRHPSLPLQVEYRAKIHHLGLLLALVFPGSAQCLEPPPASSPDLVGTAKMLRAHSALMVPEIVDPQSRANRSVFQELVYRTFAHQGGMPVRPMSPRSNGGALPGTLKGEFSVDNRGAALYHVRLPLPVSRLGPQPSATISYQSTFGHGVMGECFYFSRGHYGSITRGRSILARDDVTRGTELGARDFFYLDGKRLLCVSDPSTRGRPGSRYRTEVDSFVTIEAQGTGDSIESFVLQDKDGDRYIFGRVGDERDGLQCLYDESTGMLGTVPAEYALKRGEDRLGNYFTLAYEHKGYGEWVLADMAYTGRRDAPPPFRVQLVYESQPNRLVQYQAQQRRDVSQLFAGIRIFFSGEPEPVAEYTAHYAGSGNDGIPRLESIDGSASPAVGSPRQPLPATRFQWGTGPDSTRRWGTWPCPAPMQKRATTILADVDGDGRQDLVTISNSITVRRSTALGFGVTDEIWLEKALPKEFCLPGGCTVQSGDFDGDGRADLMAVASNGSMLCWRSSGARFEMLATVELSPVLGSSAKRTGPVNASERVRLGDFNGDGRCDVLVHDTSDRLAILPSRGDRFDSPVIAANQPPVESGTIMGGTIMDMNGDGNDDYVWIERLANRGAENESPRFVLQCALARPEGGFEQKVAWESWSASPAVWSGDFNGDALPDFLVSAAGGDAAVENAGRWSVILNRGRPVDDASPPERAYRHISVDSCPWITAAAHAYLASTEADGSARVGGTVRGLEMHTPGELQCVDVNGDGRDDIVWRDDTADRMWKASLSAGDGSFRPAISLTDGAWAEFRETAAVGSGIIERVAHDHDLNGDGLPEWILFRRTEDGSENIATVVDGAGDCHGEYPNDKVVTGISDGLGRTLDIAYRAAKDDRVYAGGAPVGYPIQDLRSSRPVVSDIWHDTGSRAYSQFSYRYAANRLDFSGRGGLGFGAFTTFDHRTRFCKLQFLAQAFPMTGLTLRDETYRLLPGESGVAIEMIASTDNAVTYDAVVEPFSGRPYGTVFSFTGRTRASRWSSDGRASFHFPRASPDRLPAPMWLTATPLVDPTWVGVTQHWFDRQSRDSPAFSALPAFNAQAIADSGPLDFLPRTITYGNATATITNHRYGFYEREVTSYLPAKTAEDTLTGLVETVVRSKYVSKEEGAIHDPITTRRYFANTSMLEGEKRENRDKDGKPTGEETSTRLERNEHGYLLARYESKKAATEKPEADNAETISYQASEFDEITGLACHEIDGEDGDRKFEYNPLWRTASVVHFDDGSRARVTHDGLGRVVEVLYPLSGLAIRTEYAWTTTTAGDWRKRQFVPPPRGITGIAGQSVYAMRKSRGGTSTTIEYRDRMDRLIRVAKFGPDALLGQVDTVYDELDRVVATSDSYVPGANPVWHTKAYDDYGAEIEIKDVTTKP